jgi:hypothetical protein
MSIMRRQQHQQETIQDIVSAGSRETDMLDVGEGRKEERRQGLGGVEGKEKRDQSPGECSQ